jgi:monoamine oxidase
MRVMNRDAASEPGWMEGALESGRRVAAEIAGVE